MRSISRSRSRSRSMRRNSSPSRRRVENQSGANRRNSGPVRKFSPISSRSSSTSSSSSSASVRRRSPRRMLRRRDSSPRAQVNRRFRRSSSPGRHDSQPPRRDNRRNTDDSHRKPPAASERRDFRPEQKKLQPRRGIAITEQKSSNRVDAADKRLPRRISRSFSSERRTPPRRAGERRAPFRASSRSPMSRHIPSRVATGANRVKYVQSKGSAPTDAPRKSGADHIPSPKSDTVNQKCLRETTISNAEGKKIQNTENPLHRRNAAESPGRQSERVSPSDEVRQINMSHEVAQRNSPRTVSKRSLSSGSEPESYNNQDSNTTTRILGQSNVEKESRQKPPLHASRADGDIGLRRNSNFGGGGCPPAASREISLTSDTSRSSSDSSRVRERKKKEKESLPGKVVIHDMVNGRPSRSLNVGPSIPRDEVKQSAKVSVETDAKVRGAVVALDSESRRRVITSVKGDDVEYEHLEYEKKKGREVHLANSETDDRIASVGETIVSSTTEPSIMVELREARKVIMVDGEVEILPLGEASGMGGEQRKSTAEEIAASRDHFSQRDVMLTDGQGKRRSSINDQKRGDVLGHHTNKSDTDGDTHTSDKNDDSDGRKRRRLTEDVLDSDGAKEVGKDAQSESNTLKSHKCERSLQLEAKYVPQVTDGSTYNGRSVVSHGRTEEKPTGAYGNEKVQNIDLDKRRRDPVHTDTSVADHDIQPNGGSYILRKRISSGIRGTAGRDKRSRVGLIVDRESTCPFLLRVFYKLNCHHELSEFAIRGSEPVAEELQIYTWMDATLRELIDLIKDVSPEARERNSRMNFRVIYPDRMGKNVIVDLGTVHSTRAGVEDRRTLLSTPFQIGDFLALAIMTPSHAIPYSFASPNVPQNKVTEPKSDIDDKAAVTSHDIHPDTANDIDATARNDDAEPVPDELLNCSASPCKGETVAELLPPKDVEMTSENLVPAAEGDEESMLLG